MTLMQITLGNALVDGQPFNSWFVGDLKKWVVAKTSGRPASSFNLRQSQIVEMKWGEHRAGEERTGWALCSDKRTISILVRGKFLLRFRSPTDREQIIDQWLEREGDYAIWGNDVEHTWLVEEDSVILTVRWRDQP